MKNETGLYKNYEYFLQATRYKIKHGSKDGRKVKQKDVAQAIGCSTVHLSGILSAKKTRKASIRLQEKIAAYFGIPLISFLELGRTLFEGDMPQKQESTQVDKQAFHEERRRITDQDIVGQVSGLVSRLHEAEKEIYRLNSIIESIGEGITIMGSDGIVVYQNSKSREIFNQNFVGKNYLEAIDMSRTKFVEGESSAVVRCFESGVTETSISWAGEKCVSGVASPLMDNSGNQTGVIFLAKDITPRQNLIDENKALVTRLEVALNMQNNAVLLYDQHKNIIFANDHYKELTGITGNEEVVDEIHQLSETRKRIKNIDELRAKMLRTFAEKKEASFDCYFSSGEKASYSGKPLFDKDGDFIGMMSIISPVEDEKNNKYK